MIEIEPIEQYWPVGAPRFTIEWIVPNQTYNGDYPEGYWLATCEQTEKWNEIGIRMDLDDVHGETPYLALKEALRYCRQIEQEYGEEWDQLPEQEQPT